MQTGLKRPQPKDARELLDMGQAAIHLNASL